MDSFNITVRSSLRMGVPIFNLEPIAQALADSAGARILRGYNLLDQPSKPLSLAYARTKVKRGSAPIRDWVQTHALMQNFGVQTTDQGAITVGWPADQQQKVAWNQKLDPMAGISPSDREAMKEAADQEFKNEYLPAVFSVL